jgi:hypothetical protein
MSFPVALSQLFFHGLFILGTMNAVQHRVSTQDM